MLSKMVIPKEEAKEFVLVIPPTPNMSALKGSKHTRNLPSLIEDEEFENNDGMSQLSTRNVKRTRKEPSASLLNDQTNHVLHKN